MIIGPDAYRYIQLAQGAPMSRPFCWRWLLPKLCGTRQGAWRLARIMSWLILAGATFWWAHNDGFDPLEAIAVSVILLALPGITGPDVVNPVGVDLPATAMAMLAAAMFDMGAPFWLIGAFACLAMSAAIKESTPIFVALWCWSPLPLAALAVPALRAAWVWWRDLEGPDPLGPKFQAIADHPIRAGINAHLNWRDGLVMVAPWGVCLAALYAPSWPLVAALAVAYLQLLVATDTVRLVHHAAGPVMAAAAVNNIPTAWLLLATVAHVFWFYKVERG